MTNLDNVFSVQNRMVAIHETREKLAKEVMADLGNGSVPGISLDRLSDFAREVIKLNAEFEMLSAQHKTLMAK